MMIIKPWMFLIGALVSPVYAVDFSVTPMAGYHIYDLAHSEQKDVFTRSEQATAGARITGGGYNENDLHEGLSVGIGITPRVDFELEYGQVQTRNVVSAMESLDSRQQIYSGHILLGRNPFNRMSNDPRLNPYMLIGAGQSEIENKALISGVRMVNSHSTATVATVGAGLLYRFNRNLRLRTELRAMYDIDGEWIEGVALTGLQVSWRKEPIITERDYQTLQMPATKVEPQFNQTQAATIETITPINDVIDTPNLKKSTVPVVPVKPILAKRELQVRFDTNQSIIKPQFIPEIHATAEFLRQYPNNELRIEGHTDSVGSELLNQRLSEHRALAVKNILVLKYHIDATRLTAIGYGELQPIAPNDISQGRALNRRVEAIVIDK